MRIKFIPIVLLALFSISSSSSYKNRDIVLQIVREMCKCYEKKDVEKLMSFWSKKSPDYKKTKNDLKKVFKDFEDIKVVFSYRGSPQIVFKKNEATVITNNKVSAKYIIRYSYKEEGDKIYFVWEKDKEGRWKIVKMKIVKKKKAQKQKSTRIPKQVEEKKIEQKFKNKDEEKIAKLSKDAIACISKRDIKCFLRYNDCSFPFGYARCKFIKIMFKRLEKGMKEEDIKVKIDETKKMNISSKRNKITILIPTNITGKYKLIYPFKINQTMITTLKKEKGKWKVWKNITKDEVNDKKSSEHKHKR